MPDVMRICELGGVEYASRRPRNSNRNFSLARIEAGITSDQPLGARPFSNGTRSSEVRPPSSAVSSKARALAF